MAGFFSELFNSFFGGDKKKPSVSQQQNSVPQAVVKPEINLPQMDALLFRASRSFIKYMHDFILTGKSVGLPAVRLSDDEWDAVNEKLLPYGVKLVLKDPYMRFERVTGSSVKPENTAAPVNANTSAFQAGSSAVRTKAFDQIKQQYPNLSDQVVQHMVDNKLTLDTNDIYEIVRHAFQPYNTPQAQFVDAANYGSHDTDDISAFAYQNWTWSRRARNRVPRESHYCGYHLSLNVHVTTGLIKALDDILARDMGQHINYYKFPKENWFHEIQYRHDPVTIYMYDRDAATEQQIVAAVAPYVRSNEGLLGQILGPGVDINTETSNNGGVSVGETIAVNIKRILDSVHE